MSQRRRNRLARKPRSLKLEMLENRQLMAGDTVASIVEYQSIDGTGNNPFNSDWGAAGIELIRIVGDEYSDGVSTPAGTDRPNPRDISNAVVSQLSSIENNRYMTNFVWQWGQFIDHDLSLTDPANPAEPYNINIPGGDPQFDPLGLGAPPMTLSRSQYNHATGTSFENPRQQINSLTAFIDGSMVYGSDATRAAALRTFSGGLMKTSAGDLLPFNTDGLPNGGGTSDTLFVAGDVRVNEQAGLTAMHTLWVREHNYWANHFASENPSWSDEELYQAARRMVISEIQAITFNEFLPTLLGPHAMGDYYGYDPSVNPGIANLFSTASYRFGHSMLPDALPRFNEDGSVASEGHLALASAFFNPTHITDHGIDSLLRGLAWGKAQEVDQHIVDGVRNFLFGPPGAGGFDLASLNIQRGRDHGLPDYNQVRVELGLAPVTSFADITSNPDLQSKLEQVYGSVDNIDPWVGGLAEDHIPGGSVGELLRAVIEDQFSRLRSGDRFWYENVLSDYEIEAVNSTRLSDIIRRNTGVQHIQDDVFVDQNLVLVKDQYGPLKMTIARAGDDVKIKNHGYEVQSRYLDWTDGIVVVGENYDSDTLRYNAAKGPMWMEGGVEYHGGSGDWDKLIIRGTKGKDRIKVRDGFVKINGEYINYFDVEEIKIVRNGGKDKVRIDDNLPTNVWIKPQKGEKHNRAAKNIAKAAQNAKLAAIEAAFADEEAAAKKRKS